MNFRQRIFLDRVLATPLSVACNSLVRVLGKISHRNHSLAAESTREIVVCKLVGMGSLIQATPLLRALKNQFPSARLTLVTLKGNLDLAGRLEGIDEVLFLNDSGALTMLATTFGVLAKLIGRKVDHYFDLEVYSGFACLLSLFSLARNRLGFYRHTNRFKKGIYTHLVYFNTRMPVRRLYLQLGCVAGVSADSSEALGTISIRDSDRSGLAGKLTGTDLTPGGYILLNPNASDLLLERRWPKGHVVAFLDQLTALGYRVALIGSHRERNYVAEICDALPGPAREKVCNTAGRLLIGEMLALMEGAQVVVTNDTGPMHIAFALRRPTVCLFGPGDPTHYGSLEPNIATLYAPVPCSPCIYEIDFPPCNGRNICMQRLGPDLVLESVRLLASTLSPQAETVPAALRNVTLPLVWEDREHNPLGVVLSDSIPNTPKPAAKRAG